LQKVDSLQQVHGDFASPQGLSPIRHQQQQEQQQQQQQERVSNLNQCLFRTVSGSSKQTDLYARNYSIPQYGIWKPQSSSKPSA
jgi:hypothetical protein